MKPKLTNLFFGIYRICKVISSLGHIWFSILNGEQHWIKTFYLPLAEKPEADETKPVFRTALS